MVDPNLELSRGPGFDLLALLAFLPSAISSFFTHIYFTWRNLLLNLKKTEKIMGHYTCFGKNADLRLRRGPAIKKMLPFFNARVLITHAQ